MWVQTVKSGVEMFAYAPDGRALYVADSAKRVTEWDTLAHKGREICTLPYPTQWGMFCAAGGRFLVARTFSPFVWDCREEREYARIDLGDHNGLTHGEFTMRPVPHDSTLLFINRGKGLAMRVWDTSSRAFGPDPTWWPRVETLRWFDVSPDGRTVALVDETYIHLADLLTGEWVAKIRLPETSGRAHFSPDGRVLAFLAHNRIWFWTLASGLVRVKGTITSSAPWVSILTAFAFHPTEPIFVALDPDGLPALFDRDTHQLIRTFDFAIGKRVLCAAFSPDGLTCALGGSNKRFAVFDLDL